MLFNEVKEMVRAYLHGEDSGTYDAVNKYLRSIYTDKEQLALRLISSQVLFFHTILPSSCL